MLLLLSGSYMLEREHAEEYTFNRRDVMKYAGAAAAGSMAGVAGCMTSQSDKFDQRRSAIEGRVQEGEHIDRLTDVDDERYEELWKQVHDRRATATIRDAEAVVEVDTKLDPCNYVIDDTPHYHAFLDDHDPAPYMQNLLEIMIDELWDLRPERRIRSADSVDRYTVRMNGADHDIDWQLRDGQGHVEYSIDTVQVQDLLAKEPKDRRGTRLKDGAFRKNFERRYLLDCDDRGYIRSWIDR